MIRWGLLLVVLAGCQRILGLDPVALGSGSDAGSGADAAACGANGHDEDCDGVPDGTDDCPGIADDQTDTDGDGVGDACDPQPGKQDKLAAFYAFDRASDLAQLTPLGGHWFVEDDALVNDETTSNQEDGVLEGMARPRPLAIETEVAIDQIGTSPPAGGAYKIGVEYFTGAADEVSCAILRQSGPTGAAVDEVDSFVVANAIDQQLAGSHLADGARYQIRQVMNAAGLRCEVTGAAGDGGTVTNPNTEPLGPESVGFYTEDTGVHYHYLAIYSLGS